MLARAFFCMSSCVVQVNCLNLWNDVAVSMGLPLGTCNVEMSVRMIYSKFVLQLFLSHYNSNSSIFGLVVDTC